MTADTAGTIQAGAVIVQLVLTPIVATAAWFLRGSYRAMRDLKDGQEEVRKIVVETRGEQRVLKQAFDDHEVRDNDRFSAAHGEFARYINLHDQLHRTLTARGN